MSNAPNLNVAIPLPPAKKMMVSLGGLLLMLSITMFGLSLGTLQGPILAEMGAMEYFSLLTVFASLGMVIMNPIGGKLGDLLGRRNIVVVSGLICCVCGVGLGTVKTFLPFAVLRLLLGAAQGAFTAAPYILAREINETKDVPKAMGMLASSVSVGTLLGSVIAGALKDAGYLGLAIMFPVVPLLAGVALIGVNLPNKRKDTVVVDVPGMLLLAVTLFALLLALNFGPRSGWGSPVVLGGLVIAVIAGFCLVKVENKANEPVLPMRLFLNGRFTVLLLIGFICYFYTSINASYAPLFVQQGMGQPATVAGTLQMPRTIVVMLLPTFFGAWVGKKRSNTWKAMAFATAIIAAAYVPLVFIGANSSVFLLIGCIGITGVAESFRAVSITPAAQSYLDRADMGIGTSMVTFINSLSGLLAAATYGIIFDASGGGSNIVGAFNNICIAAVVAAVIGFVVVLTSVRKNFKDN